MLSILKTKTKLFLNVLMQINYSGLAFVVNTEAIGTNVFNL